ncbi:G2/M phase-specific E3 ubiquitin-protein ligase-like isoform X2 [Gadus chalcogrammus]|nr:G2/M phase-specific E3 ubiquitin-protein ligase-like isoform X2 [Gadus chalcogrammus]
MPLNVEPQWSTTQILPAALKKQRDFNQNAMDDGEYVLLYPDGSQVENIPGTDRPFVLENYKEAIGKSYQRITLYICLLQDLSYGDDSSSESDDCEAFGRLPMKMSPKQSLPTTSRASGGQANGVGAGPKKTTSPNTSCEFYNTYTNVYAPVVIDSSSSDVEEVDYSQVEDREHVFGLTAADVLSNLSEAIDTSNCSRFNINRANVWDGALRGFKRSSFDPTGSLLVKFTDDIGQTEDAVDTGGPTREFLTLLMDAIKNRRFFEGREDGKYLSFDSKAADGDEYFHVGRMVAMSIVHGGPGPRCFSENFYHYLVGKVKTIEAPIADIPDPELRNVLLEIKNATTLQELLELADKHASMLQTAGCYRCLRTLEDKEQVVNDYIQWYFTSRNHVSFQGFKDGLATLNLFNALEQHPSLFLPYLVYSAEDLKAETLEALFRPQMSPTGSSNRQEEERVLGYWLDYLIAVKEEASGLSLQDVLMFATGLK